MMSTQAEAWQIMNLGLGMTYGKSLRRASFSTELTHFADEIGDVFAKWNTDGELVHNHYYCQNFIIDLTLFAERHIFDRNWSSDQ